MNSQLKRRWLCSTTKEDFCGLPFDDNIYTYAIVKETKNLVFIFLILKEPINYFVAKFLFSWFFRMWSPVSETTLSVVNFFLKSYEPSRINVYGSHQDLNATYPSGPLILVFK